MSQRVWILLTLVVGGFFMHWSVGALMAADGSPGITLTRSSAGWLGGVIWLVLTMVPLILVGLITSARGNPLTGIFAMGLGLCFFASQGGPMDGVFWHGDLPRHFGWLIAELVGWIGLWSVILFLVVGSRDKLRAHLGPWAQQDEYHLGTSVTFAWLDKPGWISAVICAAVMGLIGFMLLRTPDLGQVLWGLAIAGAVGGMMGRGITGSTNVAPVLISPLLLACAAYGFVLVQYDSSEAVIAAWYANQLHLAAALPIHFAAAGVSGVAFGLGVIQMTDGEKESSPASA